MRFLLSLMVLLFGATVARAQTADETYIVTGVPRVLVGPSNPLPIIVTPGTSAATQAAGTITLGGTFQTVLAANASRRDCLIQNTATHIMYVYVGTLGSATTTNSFQLGPETGTTPGGTFNCASASSVVAEAINITTSTTADPFVYLTQ